MERWRPRRTINKQEDFILKRLRKTRKLFAFLRDYRQELFDEEFQGELEEIYRQTGAGKPAMPPAFLAMVTLLQGYTKVSDAEAVELTIVDLRWQMVLDRLGETDPAFAQSTLVEFRNRLIETDMDRRLLERTIELAKKTKAFDWKKLPKDLRIAIDSSPLEGAGRVEDTINLLAHAARKIVECIATLLNCSFEEIAKKSGIPVLIESSVKSALDINWGDNKAKSEAINKLIWQIDSLDNYLKKHFKTELKKLPLKDLYETLQRIREQDLEPDPLGGGGVKIREGVSPDRLISIEDKEMRHGRKSNSKAFNGYKRHVATDLETNLIMACAVMPANRPEGDAAPDLKDDIARQILRISELHCDRGYIASDAIHEILDDGGEIICKPWMPHNSIGKYFTKMDFKINLRDMTIMCPAGEIAYIELGSIAVFDRNVCRDCELRSYCTKSATREGRTVLINEDEHLQQRLRKMAATKKGRSLYRQRTSVEHSLARISHRQGNKARYRGTRKNLYDLRRVATIQNLEIIDSKLNAA
ncbi:MAG: IS1182 family transposase [Oligoflexales bacterium]|nr:IS1182 family transposase [Oligoflexales bacterium]